MSDERLDQLIDGVARQMTRGQLSSDFRARVIASLDRRPPRMWRPMWIVAPLVATAAIVLAIALTRQQSGQVVKPQAATVAPRPETATVPLPPSPLRGFGGTGKPDTTDRAPDHGTDVTLAAGRRAYRPSDAAAAIEALAPAPLEPASIGVIALGIEALPTASIAVRQLDAIAPIVVDPLPTDNARPPDGDERRPSDGGQSGVRGVSDPGLRSGP